MLAGVAHVGGLEQLEELPVGETLLFDFGYLLVVGVARRKGLLKDRRVRGHPGKSVIADTAGELTGVQYPPVDAVEPDRLPGVVKLLQPVRCHENTPPLTNSNPTHA